MTDRRKFVTGTAAACVLGAGRKSLGNLPDRRIRVGQIGTKHGHASGKLATVQKYPNVFELVGVVENDREQQRRARNDKAYKDVAWMLQDDLLGDDKLDLVLIEGDIQELLPTAHAAIEAGKHIHLDKPAGVNYPRFVELLDLAANKKLQVQLGYMYRSNPAFQFLFQAVQENWLGEIFELHAVMSKKISDSARVPLARYRGGSMFELGCHLIDAAVIILGEPTRVTSINRSTRNDGLFDNCLAVLEYKKATATIRSALVEVDGFRRRQFVVCGTNGTIEIKPLDRPILTLTLEEPQVAPDGQRFDSGTYDVPLAKSAGRYDGDLLALADAILGKQEYPYSYAHDALVQKCVLQASNMSL